MRIERLFIGILVVAILAGCGEKNVDISQMSVDQWQGLSITEKAKIVLTTKAAAAKTDKGKADYLHIQTLISLSPPLTKGQWNQYEHARINLMRNNSGLGDYEKELVAFAKDQKKYSDKKSVIISDPKAMEALKNTAKIDKDNPLVQQAMADIKRKQDQKEIDSKIQGHSNSQKSDNNIDHKPKNLIDMVNEMQLNAKKENHVKEGKQDKKQAIETSAGTEELYAEGNFPSGKYIKSQQDLEKVKNFSNGNYYYINNLKVDSSFNNGYVCYPEKGLFGDLFGKKGPKFFVTFSRGDENLKEGTILNFNLMHPLKINSVVRFKDPGGNNVIRYNCSYEGEKIYKD